MDTLLQDVRYGIRLLARAPGFTIVTVLALAVGIGANSTIVSIGNALVIRPLPVREPERLVRVFSNRHSNMSMPDILDYQRGARTLDGVAAFGNMTLSLRIGQGAPEPLFGQPVNAEYFDLLGVPAALGRTLLASEGAGSGMPVVVLSDRCWQRRFGADRGAIGRQILLNGQPFTIVGVMPPTFTGLMHPLAPEVWLPLATEAILHPGSDLLTARARGDFQMIGRLRAGATVRQAQEDLDVINRELQRAYPATNRERGVTVYQARTIAPEIAQAVTPFVAILLTLSALVLFIACLNVANLLLARSTARVGELGIRLAIGAGRARLIRQMLTESALLALGGGALGLIVAFWLTHLINGFTPPAPIPIAFEVTPDWRVLVATLVVSLACAVVFGLVPALAAWRGAVASSLRRDTTRGSGQGRSRLRAFFLVAQVSLSLVLLVVSALLVQSVRRAGQLDLGFRQDHVLSMAFDLEVRNYTPERGRALYRDMVEQVRAVPGVRAAHVLRIVPVTLSNMSWNMIKEGQPEPAPGQEVSGLTMVYHNVVGPGHFETLGIPRLAGRDFTARDTADAPQVAIVNETLARRFWPGESAIGKRLRSHDTNPQHPQPPFIEVVGVVKDSNYATVGEGPRPFMYRPFDQDYTAGASLLVLAEGSPTTVVAPIRQVLRRLDPDLPVFDTRPMTDVTSISLLPIRLAAAFLGVLGLLVLALAAIGLYGVLSFLVRLRTKEIGIRMALGADRPRVLRTIMGDALRWIAYGLATGLAMALLLTPFAASLLYGIPPRDWVTFAGVSVVLTAVGVAASAVPALRATRVDPLSALRTE